MGFLAVIPARYHSSRFPGKPLAMIHGKAMIQWVYSRAMASKRLDQVIVATDDERIMKCVQDFGGEVMMTSKRHKSGTDRCAEISEKFPQFEYIINLQGDEPGIHPNNIDALAELLLSDPSIDIASLKWPIEDQSTIMDPDVVKLVTDKNGKCLYFSRSMIPFSNTPEEDKVHFKHLGIYGFRREALLKITQLETSVLEATERLEQLRWLENGWSIYAKKAFKDSTGIDKPKDLTELLKNFQP